MPVILTVREGPHAGRVFRFEGHETFLVGRAAEAHFHLPGDPYFSRFHLLIEVNPPLCRLTDLHSRNGTLVNDVKIQSVALRSGDTIRGGKTLLTISISGEEAEPTLDLGTPPPAAPIPQTGLNVAPGQAKANGGTLLTPPPRDPTFPEVPGYTIAQRLGSGAMGVVYRALRESDRAVVAVKTIKPAITPTDVVVNRFLREASILQSLKHPNIVGFHEMGSAAGLLWFAMEFVPGVDARALVERAGPLPIRQAIDLAVDLLEALGFAHRAGFVHRDIKPANLLVVEGASRRTAKLADFGLARVYQSSSMSGLTLSYESGGTPLFMPPEQITAFRTAQPAADQYSAAATLYYLLTGKAPYQATSTEELFKKILQEDPRPLSVDRAEAPAALASAIHRALSRKPEARFPDVRAFRLAIDETA